MHSVINRIDAIVKQETEAILNIPKSNPYEAVIDLIHLHVHKNGGKLITSGMGKAGQIAHNIATTIYQQNKNLPEAEVTKLQSETALNAAKVEQAEAEPQLKVAELQSKLQQKREELDLRERLSAITNDMRKQQTDVQAAVKMAAAAVKPTGGNNNGK